MFADCQSSDQMPIFFLTYDQEDDPEDLVEVGSLSVVDLSTDPCDDDTEDDPDDERRKSGLAHDCVSDQCEQVDDDGRDSDDPDVVTQDVDLCGDCSIADLVSEQEVQDCRNQATDSSDNVTSVVGEGAGGSCAIPDVHDGRNYHQNSDDEERPSGDFCVVEE